MVYHACMHGPQCIAAQQGFQKMMGMFIHLYRGVRTGAELSEIRLVDATRLARGAFSKLIPTYQRHVGINFFGSAKTVQLCCR